MTKDKKLSNLKNLNNKIDQNSNFNKLPLFLTVFLEVTCNCSAFGAIFVSVSLVKENQRELRKNLKHKIQTIDAFIPCNSEKIELGR